MVSDVYPIRVIVEVGREWKAWPARDGERAGDGQVEWWAQQVDVRQLGEQP